MMIRRLTPDDADAFQALRLFALQDVPSAFGSSYEEERAFTASVTEDRLAIRPDRGLFGAFVDGTLIAMVALGREGMKKLEHKAFVWGMYVKPEHRGQGVARALLREALTLARSVPEIRQVNLRVNANNGSATRLYESTGFSVFGREKNAMLVDGDLHDELYMALQLEG